MNGANQQPERTLLVLEDEFRLRRMIVRALSRLPQVSISEAGTLQEARELLAKQSFSLILSDIDLPDGIGIDLLGELDREKRQIPIIFMTAYLGVYGEQIPQHNGLIVLEKPFELDDLRKMISQHLSVQNEEVNHSPFSLIEYIQISCLGRHSVVIALEQAGEVLGQVLIVEGTLWSAIDSHTALAPTSGVETLSRLLFQQKTAQIEVRRINQPDQPQNIFAPWESVLLDLARAFDEEQAGRGAATDEEDAALDAALEQWASVEDEGATEAMVTPEPPQPPAETDGFEQAAPTVSYGSFDEAWDAGVEALLCKDFSLAQVAFRAAATFRPDDPRVKTNLERLATLV